MIIILVGCIVSGMTFMLFSYYLCDRRFTDASIYNIGWDHDDAPLTGNGIGNNRILFDNPWQH
jgi:hypothetical protein